MIESRFSVSFAAALLCALLSLSKVATAAEAAPAASKVLGTVEAGKALAQTYCSACHGENGNSVIPENPSLAGQNAVYIREQLEMFKSKKRPNPVMTSIVEARSEQDFADAAAYYSAQTSTSALTANGSYFKAGQRLFQSGNELSRIPACTGCHGPAGQGNPGSGYPALRSQQAPYTAKQLQDYLTKNRYRDASDPAKVYQTRNSVIMTTIAERLTPEDIRNVASYIQGLR